MISVMSKRPPMFLTKKTNPLKTLIDYSMIFYKEGRPDEEVIQKAKNIHIDSVMSALAAISTKQKTTSYFRQNAFESIKTELHQFNFKSCLSTCYGYSIPSLLELSTLADISATLEFESTPFRILPFDFQHKSQVREIQTIDLLSLITNCAQGEKRITGTEVVRAMILLEEIRAKLNLLFLKGPSPRSMHTLESIACLISLGTIIGLSPNQIEMALGLFLTNYIDLRYNRFSGDDFSPQNSKLLMLETAFSCFRKIRIGLTGPVDLFEKCQTVFGLTPDEVFDEKAEDMKLEFKGDNFSIMQTNFRIGTFGVESWTAIECLFQLLTHHKLTSNFEINEITKIKITTDRRTFDRINQIGFKFPRNQRDAQNSPSFVIASLIHKAYEVAGFFTQTSSIDDAWKKLIMMPGDFSIESTSNTNIGPLFTKIEFVCGGQEFENQAENCLPTQVEILAEKKQLKSDVIIYPAGHYMNEELGFNDIFQHKIRRFGELSMDSFEFENMIDKLDKIDFFDALKLKSLFQKGLKNSAN